MSIIEILTNNKNFNINVDSVSSTENLLNGVDVVDLSSEQILTNKTINAQNNTLSNISQSNIINLSTDLSAKAPKENPIFTGSIITPLITPGYIKNDNTGLLSSSSSIPQSDITNLSTDLLAKAPINNPSFTGTITTPLITPGYIKNNNTGLLSSSSSIPQSDITNLSTDLLAKAPINNPSFTGTITTPLITPGYIKNNNIGLLSSSSSIPISDVTTLQSQLTNQTNNNNNQLSQNINSDLYAPYGLNNVWNLISVNPPSTYSGKNFPGGIVSFAGASGNGTYTTDGINFNPTIGLGQFYVLSDYTSLGYAIAIYYGGGGLIKSSTDGINWTVLTNSGVSALIPSSNIIFFNGYFLIYTQGALYSSPDGITWTLQSSATRNIYQLINCGSFCASIGTGGPQYSLNGLNWFQCVSTQNMGTVAYNQNLNMLITTPLSTNLNNFYFSLDNGITWQSKINGNLNFNLGWQISLFNPINSKFYFIGRDASNNAIMGFITNYTGFINSAPMLGIPNLGGGSFLNINVINNNMVVSGNTSPYYVSLNTNLNLCSPQPLLCLQERRIMTNLNNKNFIFVSVTEQQMSGVSVQAISGLNFAVNLSSGVITYSGPTLNFNINIGFSGFPTTNQANNSLIIYLKRNTTQLIQSACASLGNANITVGGSSSFFQTLNNGDTLTAFGFPSSSFTWTSSQCSITIRQLYN